MKRGEIATFKIIKLGRTIRNFVVCAGHVL